jgi:4-amino-4-deoxy-L-arabinose transferase-like glycosyltransferase
LNNVLRSNWIFNLLALAIIFIITIAIFGYFSTIGADPHHDGIMFKSAFDVASGSMLFRDTFTQYGALSTIIQALSLVVFGKYLITIKFVTVFFYGLISVFLYLIFKRILPKILVFTILIIWISLAPFYILTFLPWSSVYALFFQLLMVWLLLLFFESGSKIFIFLAGASSSLIFWCRQPVGAFVFLAVLVFFIYLLVFKNITALELKKYLANYVSGSILISMMFVLWLVINHAFIDWWKQSILLPIFWVIKEHATVGVGNSNIIANTNVINNISAAIASGIDISINRGISISGGGGVLYLARAIIYGWPLIPIWVLIKNSRKPIIVLLAFVCLASGLQFYPQHDIRHCYWGGTLILGLFALLIYQLVSVFLWHKLKINKKLVEYLSAIIFMAIFLPVVFCYIKEGLKKVNKKYYFVDQPSVLKNIRLTKEEVDFYTSPYLEIERYFKDNPNGNVISEGFAIFLTFDPRIKNFHPMYVNWGTSNMFIYPDFDYKLKQYTEINKPLILSFKADPLKRNISDEK